MECYSEERDKSVQDAFAHSTVFQHIARHCRSVLDVGCGSAGICQSFGPDTEYCGVDYSPLACQIAHQRYGSFKRRFLQTDLHTWKTDEKFDIALSLTMFATYRSHGWEDKWADLFHLMDQSSTQVLFFYEELLVINSLLHIPGVHEASRNYIWLIAPVHVWTNNECIAEAYAFKNHELCKSLF